MDVESLTRRFERVFRPEQATVLAEAFHDAHSDLVKASDFNELKEIVRDLAQAQQELTLAQRDTDNRLAKLIDVVTNLTQEVGGLSRSASYALENEAYRQLPAFLEAQHGIFLDERLVRTEIGGEEIDIFALGQRDGAAIVLVGETKLQMDRRRGGRTAAEQAVAQLDRKAAAVLAAYPDRQVVRLLVTHYARPAVREVAQASGVILVQSFEW